MAGAKNRAKKDRLAQLQQASEAQNNPIQQPVRAYDGPGESSRGAPPSSASGGNQGRGRSGSIAPPSTGQQSVRSPSRGRTPSQVRGTSTNLLRDRTALMSAARLVDLPGNAYIVGDEVSRSSPGPLFQKESDAFCAPPSCTGDVWPYSNPSTFKQPSCCPPVTLSTLFIIFDLCIHRRFPTASLPLPYHFPLASLSLPYFIPYLIPLASLII